VSLCQRQLDRPGQWAVCLCQCVLPSWLAPIANQALGFDNFNAETGVDTTKHIFEDTGNTIVYDHVLKFLLKDTAHEGWDWNADSLASLKHLETDGVLQDLHIEGQHVTSKDMYLRYQFTNLQKLSTLYNDIASTVETEESYKEEDSQNICQCSQLQEVVTQSLCRNSKQLARPEYSLSARVVCEGLWQLPCTTAGVTLLLDELRKLDPLFLSQTELLYLVLLIFEYEISYTASGGFTTLHRITDSEQAQVSAARSGLLPGNQHTAQTDATVPQQLAREHRLAPAPRPHAGPGARALDAARRILPFAHAGAGAHVSGHAARRQLDRAREHGTRRRHLPRAEDARGEPTPRVTVLFR